MANPLPKNHWTPEYIEGLRTKVRNLERDKAALSGALLQFVRTVDVSTIRPGKRVEAKWTDALVTAEEAFKTAGITI